jgi:hypothetical protein
VTGRSTCRDCINFRNDPAELEFAIAGMTSLSSAYIAARGEDGLCIKRDRYVGPAARCSDYEPTTAQR